MLTPSLIILALLVVGVGVVIWAARRKPAAPSAEPLEADTAWNDPITPGESPTPRETIPHEDAPKAPPPQDPRP